MKTYFIKTFGCQMNESDSERIAKLLQTEGLREASDIKDADLAVFTTCGVRQTAEDRAYGQIHNLWKRNPEITIVLTGCLAKRKDVRRLLEKKVAHFIAMKDITRLGSILGLQKQVSCDKIEENDYLKVMPDYKNKKFAFVPIMTGCNNFCSYCVVPYARGREWSRPVSEIFKEIKALLQNGCKEVTLLGQNVNSYSFISKEDSDLLEIENLPKEGLESIDFPTLLTILANDFPGINFRFMTSHPKDLSDELIDVIAEHKNIPKEIHLPIQSGSDKILKEMNRKYTQKHYLEIIDKIKKRIPGVKISTDVIIGFPGETKKDFKETIKVFETVKYSTAFFNKYSPRPGTASEKLEDSILWEEKKKRELLLKAVLSDQNK